MYNNQGSLKTPQTFLKTITIIHSALLIGQVLFGVVTFYITNSTVINLNPAGDVYFYIVPLFFVIGMLAGSFIFKQHVAKLADKNALPEKLSDYQTALIIKYALTEGTSLFGIVVYLLTGNLLYLIFTGLNILYFIWMRPTKDKIEEDMNLSYEDKIAMEDS
jgi:hypothetical protein